MRVSRAEGFIGDTWQINILALSCPLKPGRSKTYNDLNSRTSLFYQVSYCLTRVITRITRKVRTGEGKLLCVSQQHHSLNGPQRNVQYHQIMYIVCFLLNFFLAFDFCRFCVVIRVFSILATTANDLRLRRIFFPRCYPFIFLS